MQSCRLEVEARRFAKAVKLLARVDSKKEWAEVAFDGQILRMRMGETEHRIPASGSWPAPVHIRSRFTKTLGERPVQGSPLALSVEDGRLTIGNFTIPCSADPIADVGSGPNDERIDEAAHILRKLHVSREKVAVLVAKANPEHASLWSDAYEPMVDRIANAWKILARSGVDPRDNRQSAEESVRYAFDSAGVGSERE